MSTQKIICQSCFRYDSKEVEVVYVEVMASKDLTNNDDLKRMEVVEIKGESTRFYASRRESCPRCGTLLTKEGEEMFPTKESRYENIGDKETRKLIKRQIDRYDATH